MNYTTLKKLATELKVSPKEVLALAPGNDPFYIGSKGQIEKAEWFGELYEKMGSPENMHIRRAHYWIVTGPGMGLTKPNGDTYLNTDNDWGFLTMAAKYARYAGTIPIENIIDKRNPEPDVTTYFWEDEDPGDVQTRMDQDAMIDSIARSFNCYNPHIPQPYLIEIWCEKSTMNDVLEPLCQRYKMNLVNGLGELSITAVHLLLDRIEEANKPARIFYISDFDPAGEGMPISVSRKIEYLSQQRGLEQDIKLIPLMLTAEQCKQYDLPRTPIKDKERRAADFEARHGGGATELDALEALHPGELTNVVTAAVEEYFDIDVWNLVIQYNNEIKDQVRKHLAGKMGEFLDDLDLSAYASESFSSEVKVDESGQVWLYDSALNYANQLRRYKEHKTG